MTPQELWNEYKQVNPAIGDEVDAWAFGADTDLLVQLVLEGAKTATASAYDEHLYEHEPLGEVGACSVILDSQGKAVCIIQTTKVSVVPFNQVPAEHAYKEGEGDRSLAYWRQVHKDLFTQWLEAIGIPFTETSKVVLEEFEVVYPTKEEKK